MSEGWTPDDLKEDQLLHLDVEMSIEESMEREKGPGRYGLGGTIPPPTLLHISKRCAFISPLMFRSEALQLTEAIKEGKKVKFFPQ